ALIMPHRAALARALLLVLLLPLPALAQRAAGVAVTGTVADQTGAVLPNAQVELRSGSGVVLQSATATETGDFQFSSVPSGRYDIVAVFPGFQSTTARVTVGN